MTEPTLPCFNPNATTATDKKLMESYIKSRDQIRKRSIRGQRLGDFACGMFFTFVFIVVAHFVGGR